MATSVYLSSPVIQINGVSVTDQCTSAVVTYQFDQNETTTFGDVARKFGAATVTSLQNNSIEIELFQSFAASETEATIFGLVGITTNIVVAPASGVASATNPIYTLTGCYLADHSPINARISELSTITLTFAGGPLTKVVS